MRPPLTYFPAHCPNCRADLTDELGEGGFWKLSDPTYSTSQILQDITCPECGTRYAYARTKTCPISRHRCLRDECMWWQRPVGHSRRDDGRCGMLPTHGGL